MGRVGAALEERLRSAALRTKYDSSRRSDLDRGVGELDCAASTPDAECWHLAQHLEAAVRRWFIRRGSEQLGPYVYAELRMLVRNGELNSTDETLEEGTSQWEMARRISELRFISDSWTSEMLVAANQKRLSSECRSQAYAPSRIVPLCIDRAVEFTEANRTFSIAIFDLVDGEPLVWLEDQRQHFVSSSAGTAVVFQLWRVSELEQPAAAIDKLLTELGFHNQSTARTHRWVKAAGRESFEIERELSAAIVEVYGGAFPDGLAFRATDLGPRSRADDLERLIVAHEMRTDIATTDGLRKQFCEFYLSYSREYARQAYDYERLSAPLLVNEHLRNRINEIKLELSQLELKAEPYAGDLCRSLFRAVKLGLIEPLPELQPRIEIQRKLEALTAELTALRSDEASSSAAASEASSSEALANSAPANDSQPTEAQTAEAREATLAARSGRRQQITIEMQALANSIPLCETEVGRLLVTRVLPPEMVNAETKIVAAALAPIGQEYASRSERMAYLEARRKAHAKRTYGELCQRYGTTFDVGQLREKLATKLDSVRLKLVIAERKFFERLVTSVIPPVTEVGQSLRRDYAAIPSAPNSLACGEWKHEYFSIAPGRRLIDTAREWVRNSERPIGSSNRIGVTTTDSAPQVDRSIIAPLRNIQPDPRFIAARRVLDQQGIALGSVRLLLDTEIPVGHRAPDANWFIALTDSEVLQFVAGSELRSDFHRRGIEEAHWDWEAPQFEGAARNAWTCEVVPRALLSGVIHDETDLVATSVAFEEAALAHAEPLVERGFCFRASYLLETIRRDSPRAEKVAKLKRQLDVSSQVKVQYRGVLGQGAEESELPSDCIGVLQVDRKGVEFNSFPALDSAYLRLDWQHLKGARVVSGLQSAEHPIAPQEFRMERGGGGIASSSAKHERAQKLKRCPEGSATNVSGTAPTSSTPATETDSRLATKLKNRLLIKSTIQGRDQTLIFDVVSGESPEQLNAATVTFLGVLAARHQRRATAVRRTESPTPTSSPVSKASLNLNTTRVAHWDETRVANLRLRSQCPECDAAVELVLGVENWCPSCSAQLRIVTLVQAIPGDAPASTQTPPATSLVRTPEPKRPTPIDQAIRETRVQLDGNETVEGDFVKLESFKDEVLEAAAKGSDTIDEIPAGLIANELTETPKQAKSRDTVDNLPEGLSGRSTIEMEEELVGSFIDLGYDADSELGDDQESADLSDALLDGESKNKPDPNAGPR